MIAALLILIVIVVFLAFLIGFNITNTCTIWFFKTYENVPVVTLVFIAFAAGVVMALLVVLFAKLKNSAKNETPVQKKAEPENDRKLQRKIKRMEAKSRKAKKDNGYANKTNSDNTIVDTKLSE